MKHFDPGRRPEGWPQGVPLHPTISEAELYERHSEDLREELAAGQDPRSVESRVVSFHEIQPHPREGDGTDDQCLAEPFCSKPHPYMDLGYTILQQAELRAVLPPVDDPTETGLGDKCLGCRREFGVAHETGLDEQDRKPLTPLLVAIASFGRPEFSPGDMKLRVSDPYAALVCTRCASRSQRKVLRNRANRHGSDFMSWAEFQRVHMPESELALSSLI